MGSWIGNTLLLILFVRLWPQFSSIFSWVCKIIGSPYYYNDKFSVNSARITKRNGRIKFSQLKIPGWLIPCLITQKCCIFHSLGHFLILIVYNYYFFIINFIIFFFLITLQTSLNLSILSYMKAEDWLFFDLISKIRMIFLGNSFESHGRKTRRVSFCHK
jgi:hypothetical protein